MRLRKIKGASALVALAAVAVLGPSAGGAQAAEHRLGADAGPTDSTPPVPYIRARARQDLDFVIRWGIQTTCGTEDRERNVTCSIVAKRKGKVLVTDSGLIHSPYDRYHFELELSKPQIEHILEADPPIVIKLVLRVRDEAGNVGTDQKRIKLVG
jgi:hypothetical protein